MKRGPHPLSAHLASAWVATGGNAVRMAAVHEGVRRYQAHPHHRRLPEPPMIWQAGTTRLLDYGANASDPIVLVIPSLINPAWVLDLDDGNSLLRWLSGQGVRPVLVDWGQPGSEERDFDLNSYVTERLVPALDHIATPAPVAVLGYCLGGTLATALAAIPPQKVSRLALLAAPWDFAAWPAEHRAGLSALWQQNKSIAQASGGLSMEVLQLMFAALDTGLMARKFEGFASLEQGSIAARNFVVLEDWANSGAALSYRVAEQFFDHWLNKGGPATTWEIDGQKIDAAKLEMPVLSILSGQDRIVPLSVTQPLAQLILHSNTHILPAGHVGMVVGSKARKLVWEPLAAFLKARQDLL
jgi:polyhydroxyalkanoate synthase subunit PhaC